MRHPNIERSTHPFPPTHKGLVISQGLVESVYIYLSSYGALDGRRTLIVERTSYQRYYILMCKITPTENKQKLNLKFETF